MQFKQQSTSMKDSERKVKAEELFMKMFQGMGLDMEWNKGKYSWTQYQYHCGCGYALSLVHVILSYFIFLLLIIFFWLCHWEIILPHHLPTHRPSPSSWSAPFRTCLQSIPQLMVCSLCHRIELKWCQHQSPVSVHERIPKYLRRLCSIMWSLKMTNLSYYR